MLLSKKTLATRPVFFERGAEIFWQNSASVPENRKNVFLLLLKKRRLGFKLNVFFLGRGGSSSGSTLENRSGGPEFDSHWEDFFLFFPNSLNQWCVLNQVARGGATLMIFKFPTK